MCENRVKCDVCRTINLAKQIKYPKPDMQISEKCTPLQKVCYPIPELPINPTCIRVCTPEEVYMKTGRRKAVPKIPYYAHGKFMYAVKAGLLVGAVLFTYNQGVWGDQQDVTEAVKRWQEYIRSINTRRPPNFDQCGNVIVKESSDSIIAPIYSMYKSAVTTCFSGIVKIPVLIKCTYMDYLDAMEKKWQEDEKQRKLRRKGW